MSGTSQNLTTPLSLRPWPTKEEESEPLQDIIKLINDQRGHFRNVTEAKLEEEIRAAEAGEEPDEASDDGDKANDLDARRKELGAAKTEMIQFLAQAHNEALTALDFISLLESRSEPRKSEPTISPALKEMTPSGTLGYDETESSKPTKEEEDSAKDVVFGWNTKNIEATADALLDKAKRLEEEMEKEAKYWEQILSIKENGWPLSRLPQERHTIGVRYGFSEAGSTFYNQGLAALRPSSDGSIVLDRGLSRTPKVVRIRMQFPDGRSEVSKLPPRPVDTEDSVGAFIFQARDSLFEEELFHEMTREARSLLSYGVRIVDDVIHLSTNTTDVKEDTSSMRLRIDLVSPETLEQTSSEPTATITDAVSLALRILLTHTYRNKFTQRSQPPPPLSADKKPPEIYQILRPVLCLLQHHSAIVNVKAFFKPYLDSLRATKVLASLATTSQSPNPSSLISDAASHQPQQLIEIIASIFSKPLSSTLTVTISDETKLTITVDTHLSDPTFGTLYTLCPATTYPDTIGLAFDITTTFNNAAELHEHILYLMVCDIGAAIAANKDCGWTQLKSGNELRKLVQSAEAQNEEGETLDMSMDGSVDTGKKATGREEWRLLIQLKGGKILLAGGAVSGHSRLGKVWLWDGGKQETERSLEDVVAAYTEQLRQITSG